MGDPLSANYSIVLFLKALVTSILVLCSSLYENRYGLPKLGSVQILSPQ